VIDRRQLALDFEIRKVCDGAGVLEVTARLQIGFILLVDAAHSRGRVCTSADGGELGATGSSFDVPEWPPDHILGILIRSLFLELYAL
jgi:hypothetical protein